MAAEDAADGEIEAFDGAVLAEGLKGVLGASRCEAAAGLLERGKADLVEADKEDEREDEYLLQNFLSSVLILVH